MFICVCSCAYVCFYVSVYLCFWLSLCVYWVTQKLPQICTVILRICIGNFAGFAVYICGNFWVTQYVYHCRCVRHQIAFLCASLCVCVCLSVFHCGFVSLCSCICLCVCLYFSVSVSPCVWISATAFQYIFSVTSESPSVWRKILRRRKFDIWIPWYERNLQMFLKDFYNW